MRQATASAGPTSEGTKVSALAWLASEGKGIWRDSLLRICFSGVLYSKRDALVSRLPGREGYSSRTETGIVGGTSSSALEDEEGSHVHRGSSRG